MLHPAQIWRLLYWSMMAKCILKVREGKGKYPLSEFWLGPGKTALEGDEYLKAIQFPLPQKMQLGVIIKLGRSKMGDLAIVGVAVLGYPDTTVPAGIRFRIGINSTAPTAYRVPAVEDFLAQNPLSDETFSQGSRRSDGNLRANRRCTGNSYLPEENGSQPDL